MDKNPTPSPVSVTDRLEALAPRLCRIAGFVTRGPAARNPFVPGEQTGASSADDAFQSAALSIVQAAARDRALLDRSDAYLCKLGEWRARSAARTQWRQDAREIPETALRPSSPDWDDDGFECSIVEIPETLARDPEEAAVRGEHLRELVEAVRRLSPDNQVVVKMLSAGASESEIAQRLGVSRPAVSQRKRTIAANLRKFAR